MGDKSLCHGARNVGHGMWGNAQRRQVFTKYTIINWDEDYFTCSRCLCSRCYPTLYIFSWHRCSCFGYPTVSRFVLELLLCYWTGSSRKVINLNSIPDALGPTKTAVLSAFHALTRADVTGSFSGKGKATCWDEFNNASTPILQAVANLSCEEQPGDGTRSGVEQLVCRMYQPKTDAKTVKALRWSLVKKNQAESEVALHTSCFPSSHTDSALPASCLEQRSCSKPGVALTERLWMARWRWKVGTSHDKSSTSSRGNYTACPMQAPRLL